MHVLPISHQWNDQAKDRCLYFIISIAHFCLTHLPPLLLHEKKQINTVKIRFTGCFSVFFLKIWPTIWIYIPCRVLQWHVNVNAVLGLIVCYFTGHMVSFMWMNITAIFVTCFFCAYYYSRRMSPKTLFDACMIYIWHVVYTVVTALSLMKAWYLYIFVFITFYFKEQIARCWVLFLDLQILMLCVDSLGPLPAISLQWPGKHWNLMTRELASTINHATVDIIPL